MKNKPKLIGITGGIGSGKSLVCKVFSTLGIPIYYADDRAKYLMAFNEDLQGEIKKAFGEKSYLAPHKINRDFLAAEVFNNSEKLKKLNSLVHPAVGKDFQTWTNMYKENPYVIKEAALLFESGSYISLDKIITVFASETTRIKRVQKRDSFRSEDEIKSIIAKQFPEKERQKLADFVIDNDGGQLILPQLLKIHQQLKG
ncbi:dephospho-CoA kinase [Flexithrix dorotheae]|uniref:dephospho-CoA kinase n=1 Tax=Flexithrix dorotheae TaxID=70993 RepID=UPI00035D041E|nr:dephospho-CoA kinase [Flexithrix dorotheae]